MTRSSRKAKMAQWHTPPLNGPKYEENTKIVLDAPYNTASSKLRTRLDEFAAFLDAKDFYPPETFQALSYRYRDMYGKRPPLGMSYAMLFVQVATVEELRAAVSAGWTWDRKVLKDPGYDCVGNPARIWTKHRYVDNVQPFGLPIRDPMHHYGITRVGGHTEVYACCGQSLDHPGCWMGRTKFQIEPYVMAPSFGVFIWDYVVTDDWDSVQRLWLLAPQRGTMWLYREKYEQWHNQIVEGKARIADAIVAAFQAVKADPSKINPLQHMQPMDRLQFEGLLHLQNRWNAIQCRADVSIAEFFQLDRGKSVLGSQKLVTKFNVLRQNVSWQDELEEARSVLKENDIQALQDYVAYIEDMQAFEGMLRDDIEPAFQQTPQFRSLYLNPSNGLIRQRLNDVVVGNVAYDPSILPDTTADGILYRSYEAFLNAAPNADNIETYDGNLSFENVPDSVVFDYINQYWAVDALRAAGVLTDADESELNLAAQKIERAQIQARLEEIKDEGRRLAATVQNDPSYDYRLVLQLGASRTIEEAQTNLSAIEAMVARILQIPAEPFTVPEEMMEQARQWAQEYTALDDLLLDLENSANRAEAEATFAVIQSRVNLVPRIDALYYSISLETYQDAFKDLQDRMSRADLTIEPTLAQFEMDFDRIRMNLALMREEQKELQSLKQEFADNPIDLAELQKIIVDAMDVDDAQRQFTLKVEQMRTNAEERWNFLQFNDLDVVQNNIKGVLQAFIEQATSAQYQTWPGLGTFALRLQRSEFYDVVRLFKGKGAENCVNAFKEMLRVIQNQPRSVVEDYFGADQIPIDACLRALAEQWRYLKVSGQYETFTRDTFKVYLEGKRNLMPRLYAFFKAIPDLSRESCRPKLMKLLRTLEGKGILDAESLVDSREATDLRDCMPGGYERVIQVLEQEPIDVDRFEDVLAMLTDEESTNARALLDDIDAVVDVRPEFERLVMEESTTDEELQDFVAQIKLEPEHSQYEGFLRVILAGEEEEEDI